MASVNLENLHYQLANIHDDRSGGFYAAAGSMMVVTTTAVVVRILCKRSTKTKLSSDDYVIIISLVRLRCQAIVPDKKDILLTKTSFLYMAYAFVSF